MIRKITGPRKVRRFSVWDLEWKPDSYELRVCGVYDELSGFRRYHTIRDFLNMELIPSRAGVWFYAHFGGGADLQFVIEEMIDMLGGDWSYSMTGSMSGSACIIAHIKRGDHVWHFVDSYWLLRSPLREIAKAIGMEKTGPTDKMNEEEVKEWYRNVDQKTLEDYNEQDCVILWKAIREAQNTILELGGQLQATLAATGMNLFRRKYLTKNINTQRTLNEIAKRSYVASRVETFQVHVPYDGLYYDINSSFPHAMTKVLPGSLRGNYISPPAYIDPTGSDIPFIAECDIQVNEAVIPPLPLRIKNRIFFPTGRWRGWFTGIDLALLLREGGRILKFYNCKTFWPFEDLRNYAEDLYSMRAKTKDPFERTFFKLLLNSLYGKFAEQPDKTSILLNPTLEQMKGVDRENGMVSPGFFFKRTTVPIAHAHVPISAYITAIARQSLFDYMVQASEVHYCDTDGFSVSVNDVFGVGEDLGGLKLEKTFASATFLVPKFYGWDPGVYGENPIIKAKGFSLKSGKIMVDGEWKHVASTIAFDHLIEGGEVRIDRMRRIRESMKLERFRPGNVTVKKRLRQLDFMKGDYKVDTIPKRFVYPDGHTRAWTVGELDDI